MPMPLDGIRVIDWTIWQQGPIASAMLGDLGAEVIKVEQRGTGDPGRYLTQAFGQSLEKRPNFYFEANNRNKRGITLDLKTEEGRQVIYDLVAKSDVFVQNYRKGVAHRLGLDYETLREHNPRLVYASASGYGPEGPDSAEPSFDYLGLARSGIMFAAGEPEMPPLAVVGGIADQMGGGMLAYGVLAALVARERHGVGQEVDASHLGSMTWLQGLSVSCKLMLGLAFPRTLRSRAGNPLWNHYECKDGKWIALAMLQSDRYWADLARAIGRPELAADERFKDGGERFRHAEPAIAILDEVFATRTRDEWVAHLSESEGDFIFSIVNSVDDLPEDPQVLANDYVVDFDHPQHGETRVLGIPVQLGETPGSIRLAAPELGQHTEEILLDVLGYDWDRITELRDRKVI
jgi:crotonobetainyl-CoA:carnitine CoA-transferase CaiB-like acyl-CoA transferase